MIISVFLPTAMICGTVLAYQRFAASVKTKEAVLIEERFSILTKELAKTQQVLRKIEPVLLELCKRNGIKMSDLIGS